MKTTPRLTLIFRRGVAALAFAVVVTVHPLCAQDSDASPQLAALIEEVAVQTEEITRNQQEIEARLARIEEAVRQARIMAARSGKKGGD